MLCLHCIITSLSQYVYSQGLSFSATFLSYSKVLFLFWNYDPMAHNSSVVLGCALNQSIKLLNADKLKWLDAFFHLGVKDIYII